MTRSPGDKLGPYEIVAPLGAGGMGEVYRARDPRLDRTVAIKVAQSHFSDRFEREARTIAALNHPHICQIYDVGPDYLVMELIDGRPLKGPLPVDQTLKYAAQIAGALDAAHRKGIAHRDLKPANILVTKTGIKLLDFGLAKTADAPFKSGSSPDDTVTKVLTGRNEIVGTLQYMSPEQLQPGVREVDTRTDIFSFGLLLYEMLTGKLAFDGPSPASVIGAILERPAPSLGAVAPLALDRLLQRCLAKDPDDRWQSAGDLRAELEWIATARPETAALPVAAKRGRWMILAVAMVALAGALGAIWTFRRAAPSAPRFKFSFDTGTTQSWGYASFSPDGSKIAFRAGNSLMVRAVDSLDAQSIGPATALTLGAWSPDGRFLVCFHGPSGELRKVPTTGGPPQVLASGLQNVRGTAWTTDRTILFSAGGPLLRVSENGGTPTPITTDAAWYPTMLPDGRHYLFLGGAGGRSEEAIYLASLESKEQRKITPANSRASLSPSGHLVYLRGTTLMALAFDTSALRVTGEPFPIASDVALITVARHPSLSVAPNGLIVYQTGGVGRTALTWLDRSGNPSGVLDDANFYQDLQISPDGNSVAATRLDPKTLRLNLWITDLKRGITSRFTPEADSVDHPAWSPDGKRISYSTLNRDVYVRDASGSGDRELLASDGRMSAWSPDGDTLVINAKESSLLVFVSAAAGHKSVNYAQGHFEQPAFSPDGRWMSYASDESGQWEVFVQSVPAGRGKWQISTNGGTQPIWRRDGKELFYRSAGSKIVAVPVKTGSSFEAGVSKVLFAVNAFAPALPHIRRQYSVSPDGQRFLVNLAVEEHPQTVLLQNWLPAPR